MKNPAIAAMMQDIQIEEDWEDGGIIIAPIWKDVDRPNVGGIGIPSRDAAFVPKIEQAMRDGAFWSRAEIKVDSAGQTYVCVTERVVGRTMKATLREIGYL